MTAGRQAWFWLAGLAFTGLALWMLSSILLPFVAGMAVAYFLDPATDRIEAWGASRTVATSLITAAFFLILILLALLLVPLLQSQIVEIATRVPGWLAGLRDVLETLLLRLQAEVSPEDLERLREAATGWIDDALAWLAALFGNIVSGGVALANLLGLLFITPVVSFYLLRDWDRLTAHVDGWLPRHRADTIREQIRLIDQTLAGFVRGQGLVCIFLGAFYGIALTLAGLKFGLVVGLIAGLISFIPYAGSGAGLLLSVGLAIDQFDAFSDPSGWVRVGIVAAIFLVGQFVEGNILSPRLVGGRVRLHAVWIIFALLAGGALLGFLGVLLAVPVAAVIGVLFRFALGRYLESSLYRGPGGGGEPPAPAAGP